ncbi:hypothetical protein [Solibacillus sp. FSL K6-1523]|uniref:hypothetical protein n=1 Tax=Solibacillus sp. FSL K6-1523 TaxID=2921471 RepID=UPI0030FBA995
MAGQKQVTVSKGNIMQWIEDYHWMIETIKESEVEEIATALPVAKVAGYGIEATMPKASGGVSDPVFYEVNRRTQYGGLRILQYKRKVSEVQKRICFVEGDREQEVLFRLLNGDSLRAVGRAMQLSGQTISRIRERIIDMMLEQK